MKVINIRNVHMALPEALYQLSLDGVKRDSRNGEVLMFPEPVTTVYRSPKERVIFWADRDANPFFHLFESLWMLAGRRDVEYLSRFNSRINMFSDDGKVFHGAYGYRWNTWFKTNQIDRIISRLKKDPNDRRAVLTMWDGSVDLLLTSGKDVPCNISAVFSINHENKLDMIVYNRSNDLVWGCYGANAVHFSILQEYVAFCVGVEVGVYRQVSNNLHAYVDIYDKLKHLADEAPDGYTASWNDSPYQRKEVAPFPLMSTTKDDWNDDLRCFLSQDNMNYIDPFFRVVAQPMLDAWNLYKKGMLVEAIYEIDKCLATDWQKAGREWLTRRLAKQRLARAKDDGVDYGLGEA